MTCDLINLNLFKCDDFCRQILRLRYYLSSLFLYQVDILSSPQIDFKPQYIRYYALQLASELCLSNKYVVDWLSIRQIGYFTDQNSFNKSSWPYLMPYVIAKFFQGGLGPKWKSGRTKMKNWSENFSHASVVPKFFACGGLFSLWRHWKTAKNP